MRRGVEVIPPLFFLIEDEMFSCVGILDPLREVIELHLLELR